MDPRIIRGVHVEEAGRLPAPIVGLPTTVAGFVGECRAGDIGAPTRITSPDDIEDELGGTGPLGRGATRRPNFLARSLVAFFENGGTDAYVVRIKGDPRGGSVGAHVDGLAAMELAPVSVVCCPGAAATAARAAPVASALIAHAEKMGDRFAIIDPPRGSSIADVRAFRARFGSSRAALYYPWIGSTLGGGAAPALLPPSGFIAGIYARVDREHGVHKAPGNVGIAGAVGLERTVTRADADVLNPESINALRLAPGPRVMGVRTLSNDPEWKYVNVRRLLLFVETSVQAGTEWVVFEPNSPATWARVVGAVENFLHGLWRAGALQGIKAEEAYFVRCDRTTMTQGDIDSGRMICLVGVAPVKPAEFVIFRIGQWTADRDP